MTTFSMAEFRASVITVSDASSRGERQDLSGPAVADLLSASGYRIEHTGVVPDERHLIREALELACTRADLVVTTGGTGIALRDVTPEATREVCERFIEGIPEQMRSLGRQHTPFAVLSRGLCGIRDRSIILNLPGSPSGACESLASVISLLGHALNLLRGNTAHPPDWHSQAK
jgi:molybdopterin adenylyltransferase